MKGVARSTHRSHSLSSSPCSLCPLWFILVLLVVHGSRGLAADLIPVACEGHYPQHLQGVCADDDAIYWCFTTRLVKTDRQGKVLKDIEVATHHGDLCRHGGKLYVAVNLGKFNEAAGKADSWVYVYKSSDLSFVTRYATPEVVHGAGGMEFHDGRFYVVGGLPKNVDENYVYEYDLRLQFVQQHTLASGPTDKGIQTAAFADGRWWFGCYGSPRILLTSDASFKDVKRYEFDAAYGIIPLGDGKLLIARDTNTKAGHAAKLIECRGDADKGLKLE